MRLLIAILFFFLAFSGYSQPGMLLVGPQGSSRYAPLLYNFPGATGAWSLRQLDDAYPGPAVRVRRASDNTEQDIGFFDTNPNFDTVSLLGFCAATSCYVTTWYDQAGSNDLYNTTDANQPRIVNSGVVERAENGWPALYFDGTNDGLKTDDITYSYTSASLFILSETADSLKQQNLFRWRANGAFGSGPKGIIVEHSNAALQPRMYGSNSAIDDGANTVTANNPTGGEGVLTKFDLIHQLTFTPNNIDAYFNADLNYLNLNYVLTGSTPLGTISGTQAIWIAYNFGSSNRGFKGWIQEAVIYEFSQATNRIYIRGNINEYYNVY